MKLVQIYISGINELRWIGIEHFQIEDQLFITQDMENKEETALLFLLREGIAFDYNAMNVQIISIRLYG